MTCGLEAIHDGGLVGLYIKWILFLRNTPRRGIVMFLEPECRGDSLVFI